MRNLTRGVRLVPFVLLLAACTPSPVAVSLAEDDATRIVAILGKSGLAATKGPDPSSEGRYVVTVSAADASAALTLMSEEDLPPRTAPSLDAMAGSSLVPSPRVEQARLLASQAAELERSLRSIDGVVSARVHLAAPAPSSLGLSLETPAEREHTASVLLKHRGEQPPIAVAELQKLIAGAISGLRADAVTVVLVRAVASAPAAEWVQIGPLVVSRRSALPARVLFGALLSVCFLLAGVLIWTRLRTALTSRVEGS